jgi:hypothetical protein
MHILSQDDDNIKIISGFNSWQGWEFFLFTTITTLALGST